MNETKTLFHVSFDSNGGEESFNNCMASDGSIIAIPSKEPTRFGCTFVGWQDSNGGLYSPGDEYTVTGDESFTALWEANTYTLTFDLDGGVGEFEPITATHGQTVFLENIPEKEGMKFVRWERNDGERYKTGDRYVFSDSFTLKAIWGYAININYFYPGGTYETVIRATGEQLPPPESDTEYAFLHYLDPELNLYDESNPYIVTKYDNLCAIYGYKVSYDLMGGTGDFPAEAVDFNSTVTLNSGRPVKSDLLFEFWKDENGNAYNPGDTITPTGNMTLKAYWTAAVQFHYRNGDDTLRIVTEREGTKRVINDTPERAGFTLDSWTDGQDNIYKPGDTYVFTKGLDWLQAWWKCYILFNYNDGTEESIMHEMFENTTMPFPSRKREGYDLVKWVGADGTEYTEDYCARNGDEILNAVWEPKTYTVTYDVNGGVGDIPSQTKVHFTDLTLTELQPTKEDYVFAKWECDGVCYESGSAYTENRDLHLTAIWTQGPKCVITYDMNGGTGYIEKQIKDLGKGGYLSSYIPEKEGFEFCGWQDRLTGTVYSSGQAYYSDEWLELTAIWKRVYTVEYIDAYGRVFKTDKKLEDVDYHVTNDTPNPPDTGDKFFDFSHWRATLIGEIYSPGDVIKINNDIKLYSKWTEVFLIQFYNTEGYVIDHYFKKKGEAITAPDYSFEEPGYEFAYWKKENLNFYLQAGEEYQDNNSVIFVPVMIETGKCAVTFDTDGASNPEGDFPMLFADANGNVTIPNKTPTKEGYDFMGWTVSPKPSNRKMRAASKEVEINDYDLILPGYTVNFAYESCILKAKWAKKLIITLYNGNQKINTFVANDYFSFVLPKTAGTKDSHYFGCWKVKGKNEYYLGGKKHLATENTDLEAVWIESGKNALIYDTKDSDSEIGIVFWDDEPAEITSIVPAKRFCIFDGWKDSSDTSILLHAKDLIRVNKVKILYANWKTTGSAPVRISNLPNANTVCLGLEHQLTVTDNSGLSDLEFLWTSSNENVAEITADGNIISKKRGVSTIELRVFSASEQKTKYYDSVKITIAPPYFGIDDNPLSLFSYPKTELSADEEAEVKDAQKKAIDKMNTLCMNEKNKALLDYILSGGTCVFAFEGLGDPDLKHEDTSGLTKSNNVHPYWLYNAMMVVTKGRKIIFVTRRASTLPDKQPSSKNAETSITCHTEGIYNYYTGNHNNSYIALRKNPNQGTGWYIENNNFKTNACSGINVHCGHDHIFSSITSDNSRGCQMIHYKDYVIFGEKVGFLKENAVEDITNISGKMTPVLEKDIGLFGKGKDNMVKIKYILDRSFDNTNGFYSEEGRKEQLENELAILEEEFAKLKEGDTGYTKIRNKIADLERMIGYYTEGNINKYSNGIFYPLSIEHLT